MMKNIIKLFMIFMVIVSPILAAGTSSEWITCRGTFSSWHDGVGGVLKDRSMAQGDIEYQAELFDGGLSSGLRVYNGSGSYSFASSDYAVRLSGFEGEIIAEADDMGSLVKGNGKGHLILSLYGDRKTSVRPFPLGEINANGYFNVSTDTEIIPEFTDMNYTDETTMMLKELI